MLKSDFDEKELAGRWDKRLDPARFAGNDDVTDIFFRGKRKGNRIKLIRRSGVSRLWFSTVFRGRIVSSRNGASIRGVFTKSIPDYILAALGLSFVFYIYMTVRERQMPMTAINFILVFSMLLAFLSLRTGRKTKRLYLDILKDITEKKRL